ncbi:hypothetical protein LAC83_17185 [Escherichia coli]|nr:hypothetical protein [Escherichia coli]MCX9736766.1 hypothetical protein [Escherichia coli]
MSDINNAGSDLIFELEDRPPFHQALVGAITHLLAIFVPMVIDWPHESPDNQYHLNK